MIVLAYDGSVHADWVSRYALRLASRTDPPRLRVVHVRDGGIEASPLRVRLDGLAEEAARSGVSVDEETVPLEGSVARSLAQAVGGATDDFLVCGSRARPGRRGLLAGTVSQKLLARPPCNVVAIRVVQPGLLGVPHRFLLPVAGHPQGLRPAAPMLRLFAPDVRRLDVLRVMEVSQNALWRLDSETIGRLRASGYEYLERVERELVEDVGLDDEILDVFVRVSSDWTREVLVHAAHHETELMVLGATRRGLTDRFLFGNRLETVLRDAPCDAVVYRAGR